MKESIQRRVGGEGGSKAGLQPQTGAASGEGYSSEHRRCAFPEVPDRRTVPCALPFPCPAAGHPPDSPGISPWLREPTCERAAGGPAPRELGTSCVLGVCCMLGARSAGCPAELDVLSCCSWEESPRVFPGLRPHVPGPPASAASSPSPPPAATASDSTSGPCTGQSLCLEVCPPAPFAQPRSPSTSPRPSHTQRLNEVPQSASLLHPVNVTGHLLRARCCSELWAVALDKTGTNTCSCGACVVSVAGEG